MEITKSTVLVVVAAVALIHCSLGSVQAGPIVFSARYYYPPGVKSASHFHIYTIEDTGRHLHALTHTRADDEAPLWSPKGGLIAFTRTTGDSEVSSLMVMNQDGSHLRKLAPTDWYSSYQWSQDGRSIRIRDLYSSRLKSIRDRVIHVSRQNAAQGGDAFKADREFELLPYYDSDDSGQLTAVLPNSDTKIQVSDVRKDNTLTIKEFGREDKQIKTWRLAVSKEALENMIDVGVDGTPVFCRLEPDPTSASRFYLWQNWHNSTVGTDYGLFCADLNLRKISFMTETKFARWAPDHNRFCGSSGRDTVNYSRKADGSWRTVWAADLFVYDTTNQRKRTLQSGLVWVTGADWRQ